MAIAATEQILQNGERNLIAKYTFAGTTGDVTALLLTDITAVTATELKIMRIHASLPSSVNLDLLWDATADVDAVGINSEARIQDFTSFGGVVNTKASGWTGSVNLRSDGWTAAAGQDNSHIIIEYRKRGNNS